MAEITDHRKWVIEQMLILGRGDRKLFRGCLPVEIDLLMEVQSVNRLPQVYVELLTLVGKSVLIELVFWSDSSQFENLFELKDRATSVFNEFGFTLPSDAFVFYDHQGEHIMYFHTNNSSDDPPIYHYVDSQSVSRLSESMTDLISENVERIIAGRSYRPKKRAPSDEED